jgi:dCTP deaminase
MILSDSEILKRMAVGDIKIDPFYPECLGSNSYDIHLSKHMATYITHGYIDSKSPCPITEFVIPEDKGYILRPGIGYLASTIEYTETQNLVPFLEGKSSTGRLFIDIHATAGKGDAGFKGHWTMEMSVTHPVKVYPGMPIGQLIYYPVLGKINNPYDKKAGAKYSGQGGKPVPSAMFKNFDGKGRPLSGPYAPVPDTDFSPIPPMKSRYATINFGELEHPKSVNIGEVGMYKGMPVDGVNKPTNGPGPVKVGEYNGKPVYYDKYTKEDSVIISSGPIGENRPGSLVYMDNLGQLFKADGERFIPPIVEYEFKFFIVGNVDVGVWPRLIDEAIIKYDVRRKINKS